MIYELRTYNVKPEHAADVVAVYEQYGWPQLKKWRKNLVGYFISDIGPLHQIVHLWKFTDHAARDHQWTTLRANPKFVDFGRREDIRHDDKAVPLISGALRLGEYGHRSLPSLHLASVIPAKAGI